MENIVDVLNELKNCCDKLVVITDTEMEKVQPYIYEDEMAYINYVNADMVNKDAVKGIRKADEYLNLLKTTDDL